MLLVPLRSLVPHVSIDQPGGFYPHSSVLLLLLVLRLRLHLSYHPVGRRLVVILGGGGVVLQVPVALRLLGAGPVGRAAVGGLADGFDRRAVSLVLCVAAGTEAKKGKRGKWVSTSAENREFN